MARASLACSPTCLLLFVSTTFVSSASVARAYSPDTLHRIQWGLVGDVPLAGDIDRDGLDDLVVWRPANGSWYVRYAHGATRLTQWGLPGDIPMIVNGDSAGEFDFMVWRPSTLRFYLYVGGRACPTGWDDHYHGCERQWGLPGDIPLAADFDGDAISDATVFRPSEGVFYTMPSSGVCPAGSDNFLWGCRRSWGLNGDRPVPADYDGDGVSDYAVWRPANGVFHFIPSRGVCPTGSSNHGPGCYAQWGFSTDTPVPADYDGDRLADLAIFRPEVGSWYIRLSSNLDVVVRSWGLSHMTPLPFSALPGEGASKAMWDRRNGTWHISTFPLSVCEVVTLFDGTHQDVASYVNQCLASHTPGGTTLVEFPKGSYAVGEAIHLTFPTVVSTYGVPTSAPRCSAAPTARDCARFVALPTLASSGGFFVVTAPDTRLDHVVVDGNKAARWNQAAGTQCKNGRNTYGMNLLVFGSRRFHISNSVSANALCGSALAVGGHVSDVVIENNLITKAGVHDREALWADGMTLDNLTRATVRHNAIEDSTDIDLIVGECRNCQIYGNTIRHSGAFSESAFAALMMAPFVVPADQTGTHVFENTIDCGAPQACGFGLYIGLDGWAPQKFGNDAVFGGRYYNNVIRNAQQGVNIDDARDIAVWNNSVSGTASRTQASCGTRATNAYNIGTRSVRIDTSLDTLGAQYTRNDWDGCIPNWWR